MSLALSEPQRFFVVADLAFGAYGALEARFGVPAGGIEYLSGNDGPIDSDVTLPLGQLLLRREIVSIDALPIPAGGRHPGDGEVELLALRVGNNTIGDITVDSLRVRGDSTLFPCEPAKPFKLYADDGDLIFDPGVDSVVALAAWSGGEAFFVSAEFALAPGTQRILYVAAALDSLLTADGETLSVGIESADDIGLALAPATNAELFRLDADFPLVSAGGGVTDGMLAHQVTLYPLGGGVIADQKQDILVFDFLVPGNACIEDTLRGLTITNLGTAGDDQIERLRLWRDGGDGFFDPASDSLLAVFGEETAGTYAVEALFEPLAGFPGSRFFVTMDVLEKIETGGTVDLAIPVMGIDVASGNDGPVDGEISGSGIFTIPVPDRLTLFTSILGNKRVLPGERNVLNLVLGVYNSYKEQKILRRLDLLSVGSSRPEEIIEVEAYTDSDEDGLFDPSIDSLLEIAQPGEAGYFFHELGAVLKPYRSTLIFISYETALGGIRDSIRIDLQVSDKSSFVFLGTPPVVQGDFPLNSAGIDITNGMVNAQIEMLPVSSARVSPGAVDIPCLSFTLPCNGSLEDVLEGLAIEIRGTASQAQDVRHVKLWKDAGNTRFAFDPDDEFLAFLVWDGSSWKTVPPLAEPIPCEGLVLHVTADIASTAQDGRNLKLCVPLGGVVVSSGNDGPIDGRACGTAMIEISTDPLFVSFDVPAAVTRDQVFEVRMGVANASDSTLLGIVADSFAWAGTGSCSSVSGPAPASMDLSGKSESAFAWTSRALSIGELVFRGAAKQNAGPEASRVEISDTIRVDEIPANVTAALLDRAPVSINRGQEDIPLVEMTIGYNPPSGQGAPVEFMSIELAMTNGAAAPLPMKDAASRMRLRDDVRVLCSVAADTIAQATVLCTLPEPVILFPGTSKTFWISIDIPLDAPASDFRLSIASSGKIALADHNSRNAVPFSGNTFPWSTNTVTLNDPANMLTMSLTPGLPARVNRGQDDVEVFGIVLANNGPLSTAPMSVSELAFTVRDEEGDSVDAGRVLRVFRLDGAGGNTYASVESFNGSATIRCVLQPPVTVSAQLPVALTAVAGCLSAPSVTGFSVSLDDSTDVAVRDVNSGRPVRVAAGAPGFPMGSGAATFCAPLESVDVAGTGLLVERIMAGSADVPVLRLILRHPGTAGESPFSCGGVTVRVLDEAGRALDPNAFLDVVRVRLNGVDFASAYITAGTGPDISVEFPLPLLVEPGGADTLDVLVDLDAAPSPSRFQMQVHPAGLGIIDATDGRSAIDVTGAFPVTSGIGRIIFPAAQTLFDADGLLPANIAVGGENDCLRLRFVRRNDSSGSRVFVERIVLDVLGEDDRAVDPSGVIETLRIVGASGEIASNLTIEGGRLVVAMPDTVAIVENETLEIVLKVATVASPAVRMFSLRVADASDVVCRDEATGGATGVVAGSGAFPYGSGRAALLGRDIRTSFSNYPNPFVAGSERTTITFYMPADGCASLRVFTVTGEPVKTIAERAQLRAGLHQEYSWDGTNGNGNAVLSGVYYLLLKVDSGGRDFTFKRKVALVR
ncbi:MAG: hypothetical protein NTW97_05080 [Candidatus Krumholzibacteria bacterium]|nr:hypothetical protein [Candidatus Krumholzibacteria bacterium]